MTYYKEYEYLECDYTSAVEARDAALAQVRSQLNGWCKSQTEKDENTGEVYYPYWYWYSEYEKDKSEGTNQMFYGLDEDEGKRDGGWGRYYLDGMSLYDRSQPSYEGPIEKSGFGPPTEEEDFLDSIIDRLEEIRKAYKAAYKAIVEDPVEEKWNERLAWYKQETEIYKYERWKDEVYAKIIECQLRIQKLEKEKEKYEKELERLKEEEERLKEEVNQITNLQNQ